MFNSSKLFDGLSNVRIQISNKRRKNDYNGMWGSPQTAIVGMLSNNMNFGNNMGFGNNQGWDNNGWEQNNGWGGNNIMGQMAGGLENAMAAFVANQKMWGNDLDGFAWVQQQLVRQDSKIIKAEQKSGNFNMNNFGDFINKQITFLEPSPAQQRLQQLKREGKQFYDDRFPPNQASLTGQKGYVSQWASIKWSKINQVLPQSQIFQHKVEPGDIKQGYLGDCYFLAGLAALAERPDRIFNLFLLKQKNSVCYYSVKILYKGKWLTVDMDQNIPCLNGKPAFSKANDNELWVVLLEKAWAKLYTSYKRIQAGYPQEPLHDLTGAPIKQILTSQLVGGNKQSTWNYLVMASQKQYAMVASSRPGSDTNKSQTGIVQGHAYTVLNATVLNYNGGSDRIMQLRNPWGKGESLGKWSDNDPNWSRVPPQQMQRIGFKKNGDDGTFFMTYQAFISEFRALSVAQINDNASYVYKSATDKNRQGAYFVIQIHQRGYYSLHVDKTPQRYFEQKLQDLYNYPNATLELGKMNGNYCQKLQSATSAKRTLFKGYTLEPGVYVAFVKVQFDSKWEKDFDVNLAVYAQYYCQINLAPRQLAAAFSGNPNVNWNPAEHQQKGAWNNLGNSTYRPGDSGWGNDPSNYNTNGWGNNNFGGGGDNGWGNTGGGGNGWGQQNNGWGGGGFEKKPSLQNDWGNTGGNNGWGGEGGNNNGWGNSGGNNGWGNSMGTSGQGQGSGWGQSHHNSWGGGSTDNNGWGDNQGGGSGLNSSWGPGW